MAPEPTKPAKPNKPLVVEAVEVMQRSGDAIKQKAYRERQGEAGKVLDAARKRAARLKAKSAA